MRKHIAVFTIAGLIGVMLASCSVNPVRPKDQGTGGGSHNPPNCVPDTTWTYTDTDDVTVSTHYPEALFVPYLKIDDPTFWWTTLLITSSDPMDVELYFKDIDTGQQYWFFTASGQRVVHSHSGYQEVPVHTGLIPRGEYVVVAHYMGSQLVASSSPPSVQLKPGASPYSAENVQWVSQICSHGMNGGIPGCK